MTQTATRERSPWIDWLRVFAIFLVLVVHSTEPFYLGGPGSCIASESDAFWVSFFDSVARACVPLFVIASSYLLLPLHSSTPVFFRRRLIRVLVPFAIWTTVYAIAWGEPVVNFRSLLLNFNYSAGHLWFVYMLMGIYLLLPILTPWATKVSKRQLLFYLCICLFTSIIPFIREWAGGSAPVIYGPTGIPNPAKYPLWGECAWNAYGLFYYFSGFIGYVLFGLYLRRFVRPMSTGRTLAIALPCWLAGFAICFGGFLSRVLADAAGTFPVEGPSGMAALWETPWLFDSFGVVLMAIGWILLFRLFKSSGRFVLTLSKASYGVYLCHMLILAPVSAWLCTCIDSTPLIISLTALITFTLSSIFCVLVQRIPRIGSVLVG